MKKACYLLFDGGCSTCSALAATIEEEAGGKVSALRIGSEQGIALLSRAFSHGYDWQPYLIAVRGETITATSGTAMAVQLGRLLGLRKGVRVYKMARQLGATLPMDAGADSMGPLPLSGLSRRTFLKLGGVIMSAAAFVPLTPPPPVPEYHGYQCTTKCYTEGDICCAGQVVYGTGSGSTITDACSNAKSNASKNAPPGCWATHCQPCTCKRV